MIAATPLVRLLFVVQGGYYVATGVWPILHLSSFELVTGEKTDDWLVVTVGALVAVVGAVLVAAALLRRASGEIVGLAIGCGVALAAIDVVYAARDVIADVYLLDAALHALLLAGWAVALLQGRRGASRR